MTTVAEPGLLDSHAHLMDPAFRDDLDQVIRRAGEAGVRRMVCVGYDAPGSQAAVDLARRLPDLLRATVGIHPNSVSATPRTVFDEVERLAWEPEVVAIGETGLDYYRDRTPPRQQRDALEWHLRLAEQRHLPLVIHNREADADVADLLEGSAARRTAGEAPGVLHCFSSTDPRYLDRMLEAGYHVSFAGTVTYRSAAPLRAMVERAPLSRLLVETDCPYLAPVPCRGRRNEPAFVRHTAQQIATIKGLSMPELCRQMWANACRLFPGWLTPGGPRPEETGT